LATRRPGATGRAHDGGDDRRPAMARILSAAGAQHICSGYGQPGAQYTSSRGSLTLEENMTLCRISRYCGKRLNRSSRSNRSNPLLNPPPRRGGDHRWRLERSASAKLSTGSAVERLERVELGVVGDSALGRLPRIIQLANAAGGDKR